MATLHDTTALATRAAPNETIKPSDESWHAFARLPPELRQAIWEACLPPQRIFHVRGIVYVKEEDMPGGGEQALGVTCSNGPRHSFRFYRNMAPPAITSVCRESRRVALLRGFFLSPGPGHPGGLWFNTDVDVLYFDRNARNELRVGREGQPARRRRIEGWERVRNVGVEWRAFFRDAPRMTGPDQDMRPYWRAATRPLRVYMPGIEILHYVLPVVRHKGGITMGREPYGSSAFEAELVPLAGGINVPWSSRRNNGGHATQGIANGGEGHDLQGIALGVSAHVPPAGLRAWADIKRELELSLEPESTSGSPSTPIPLATSDAAVSTTGPAVEAFAPVEVSAEARGERGWTPRRPRIVGSWLLRREAPTNYDNPEVREFLA